MNRLTLFLAISLLAGPFLPAQSIFDLLPSGDQPTGVSRTVYFFALDGTKQGKAPYAVDKATRPSATTVWKHPLGER